MIGSLERGLNGRMKIYTKGGDSGETGLFGGKRVPKDDLRICTYGTVDELNAVLGVVLSRLKDQSTFQKIAEDLLRIQNELFQLGAELATPKDKNPGIELIDPHHCQTLEKEIDQMEKQLKPLKTFILPGGGEIAGWFHLARTVCRRAERNLISLNREEPVRPDLLQYVNRLSDYFFVLARFANHLMEIEDVPWISHKKKS